MTEKPTELKQTIDSAIHTIKREIENIQYIGERLSSANETLYTQIQRSSKKDVSIIKTHVEELEDLREKGRNVILARLELERIKLILKTIFKSNDVVPNLCLTICVLITINKTSQKFLPENVVRLKRVRIMLSATLIETGFNQNAKIDFKEIRKDAEKIFTEIGFFARQEYEKNFPELSEDIKELIKSND